MNEIIYIAKCGCRLKKSGTYREKGYSRVCREHKEKILSCERKCLDCDKILALDNTAKGPFRCESCFDENHAEMRHRVYLKHVAKKENHTQRSGTSTRWSYNPRGDYCTGIISCNIKGPLKCENCEEFVGIYFGHDPLNMPGYMRIKDLTFW
jgi:hypothetical protein